ncbi:hypothetical protein L7F22_067918 [Adiantum nelumboides]|nr:hypothetical protein [Adiantum nelumboides]
MQCCKGKKSEAKPCSIAEDPKVTSLSDQLDTNAKRSICQCDTSLPEKAPSCSCCEPSLKQVQKNDACDLSVISHCKSVSDHASNKDCKPSCCQHSSNNAAICCGSSESKSQTPPEEIKDANAKGTFCSQKECEKPLGCCSSGDPLSTEKDCCIEVEDNIRRNLGQGEDLEHDEKETLCSCCAETLLDDSEDILDKDDSRDKEKIITDIRIKNKSYPRTNFELFSRMIPKCCQMLQRRCCINHKCEEVWKENEKRTQFKSTNLKRTTTIPQETQQIYKKNNKAIPLRIIIGGMDCADCAPRVEKAVKRLHGVHFINLDYFQALVDLTYENEIIQPEAIQQFIARATGFTIKIDQTYAGLNNKTIYNTIMTLDYNFDNHANLDQLKEMSTWQVTMVRKSSDSLTIRATFPTNGPLAVQPRYVHESFSKVGGTLLPSVEQTQSVGEVRRDVYKLLLRFIISLMLCIPTLIFAWAKLPQPDLRWELASLILASFTLIDAYPFFDASIRSIIFLRQTVLLVLVSISVAIAYTYSLVSFIVRYTGYTHISKPFFETVTLLITLIYLGRLTQAITRMRVANEIQNINSLSSTHAKLIKEGEQMQILHEGKEVHSNIEIDKRLLHYGDTILVEPDSIILTDGIVIGTSCSAVDESSITGESVPVFKQSGMTVYAGSKNLESPLFVQVTNLVHENSLSNISKAISKAFSTRSTFQDLSDRVARILLPIAILSALLAFLIWTLVEHFLRRNDSNAAAATIGLSYGIAILVVSCPCALGLSVPLITSLSILTGAREGVLYRSSESISRAAKVNMIAFDKTGTLSTGEFSVVHTFEPLLNHIDLVYAITKDNKHPVAKSVYKHISSQMNTDKSKTFNQIDLRQIQSIPGKGISATFKSFTVLAGSATFTGVKDIDEIQNLLKTGLTLFTVTIGGRLIVAYGLQDNPRPESKQLISTLRSQGKDVLLISGDHSESVQRFSNAVGIDPNMVFWQCLPEQKAKIISSFRQNKKRNQIAFVGDGTNDSIAFAAADVSFAIATASDIAKGTGDILLLSSRLDRNLLNAMQIAQMGRKMNIIGLSWCIFYAVIAILLAAGVAVHFSIEPRWAGLGEVVSVIQSSFSHLAYRSYGKHDRNKIEPVGTWNAAQ